MSRELEGKVAIVTGAATGIGKAITRAFGAADANVVVNDVCSELRGVAARTFFTAWIVSAGSSKTSPASSVVGGLPSTRYSSDPSRT
jgi:NAD(P)-dependent dehydrogenase (short-subunit alcohol dehydrogenase family)